MNFEFGPRQVHDGARVQHHGALASFPGRKIFFGLGTRLHGARLLKGVAFLLRVLVKIAWSYHSESRCKLDLPDLGYHEPVACSVLLLLIIQKNSRIHY